MNFKILGSFLIALLLSLVGYASAVNAELPVSPGQLAIKHAMGTNEAADLAFVLQDELGASDPAASDYFGTNVAISGDTAIVGTARNLTLEGSAYIFVRKGTTWTQQAKLTTDVTGDGFGFAVAVNGNTAIVGASATDSFTGAAYVFVRNGTTWTQQAKLTASDGGTGEDFGFAVAVDGDTAMICVPNADVGTEQSQGAAYVFVRSGTTWSEAQKLTVSDGIEEAVFGKSVALSGDTAIIGGIPSGFSSQPHIGSAYVFVRNGTTWSEQQKLTASDAQEFDYFGSSVALSGDTAIVGAYAHDMGDIASQGAAYVFNRNGTNWSQEQKLTDSDGARNDSFGHSVSVSGDLAVIGADRTNAEQGSVYVFRKIGTSWSEQDELTVSNSSIYENFGYSVSLEDDTVIIGAPGQDTDSVNLAGAAYVFTNTEVATVPAPNVLLNISTRLQVLTDDKVLIGGFIVSGDEPKTVILRAIGPALADFGISDALADPVLELHASDGSLIMSNDNWKMDQQSEIEMTGLAPSKDLESAILATLDPGAYTAIVSGKDGGTGVGLVEVYDLDAAAASELANISTRGFVETGNNLMIGGFILGGDTGVSNVLIRAIGPTLTDFGVAGALEDPTLELHDAQGALISSNDNWMDDQQDEIEATGLAPQNDLESAILEALNPGAYTAIVFGADGGTGVGLIEVYRLP